MGLLQHSEGFLVCQSSCRGGTRGTGELVQIFEVKVVEWGVASFQPCVESRDEVVHAKRGLLACFNDGLLDRIHRLCGLALSLGYLRAINLACSERIGLVGDFVASLGGVCDHILDDGAGIVDRLTQLDHRTGLAKLVVPLRHGIHTECFVLDLAESLDSAGSRGAQHQSSHGPTSQTATTTEEQSAKQAAGLE